VISPIHTTFINIFVDPGTTFQSTNRFESFYRVLSSLGLQRVFFYLLIISLWF